MAETSAAEGHTRRRFAQLRAVIWDMDGTLLDSVGVVPDAFIATARARSGRTYTRQQIVDLYHLGPPPIMLPRLLGRDATAADRDDYHTRLQTMVHRVQPLPGDHRTAPQAPTAPADGGLHRREQPRRPPPARGDRSARRLYCGGGRRRDRPAETPPGRHPPGL